MQLIDNMYYKFKVNNLPWFTYYFLLKPVKNFLIHKKQSVCSLYLNQTLCITRGERLHYMPMNKVKIKTNRCVNDGPAVFNCVSELSTPATIKIKLFLDVISSFVESQNK